MTWQVYVGCLRRLPTTYLVPAAEAFGDASAADCGHLQSSFASASTKENFSRHFLCSIAAAKDANHHVEATLRSQHPQV